MAFLLSEMDPKSKRYLSHCYGPGGGLFYLNDSRDGYTSRCDSKGGSWGVCAKITSMTVTAGAGELKPLPDNTLERPDEKAFLNSRGVLNPALGFACLGLGLTLKTLCLTSPVPT